ncbi:Ubiquitin carboxyl-terminal hydrolase 12 [Morella rubra]|uniref:Ubiquitin carboxyl-terminal hydrolase 12 n=1 Tax=Morella rubra TaxID=262757 RepID=A0A6A1UK48_9ROSI|nr:Ubiquitin carboxyl-terminal hydrolase 12 [Morella rubra]
MLKIFPGDTEPKYDSDVFECGGYKWRLSFYPNGRKDCNGKGSISLYLVISETDSLPLGWEVNAVFRLFVLDQIRGEYLTLQDANGEVRLFHAMKTEWGFARFLSLSTFGDALNGYLVDDSCVFGAEVFVIKCTGEGECLSSLSSPITSSSTWEIEKFSTLSEEYLMKELRVGDRQWELKLYPGHVSPDDGKSYVGFDLSNVDWFSPLAKGYSFAKFMLLVVLRDPSRSFLLNDTLVFDTNIEILSVVKKELPSISELSILARKLEEANSKIEAMTIARQKEYEEFTSKHAELEAVLEQHELQKTQARAIQYEQEQMREANSKIEAMTIARQKEYKEFTSKQAYLEAVQLQQHELQKAQERALQYEQEKMREANSKIEAMIAREKEYKEFTSKQAGMEAVQLHRHELLKLQMRALQAEQEQKREQLREEMERRMRTEMDRYIRQLLTRRR